MTKWLFTFAFLISFAGIDAQPWSNNEINIVQNFSIKNLKKPSDPSNKYLNNLKAINLGKALFNDKRLSSDRQIACSSCHIEKHAFTDNRKLAFGIRKGFRNTSTLVNISSQDWFFADGAKDSLWTQALSSIENPAEQNFTRLEIVHLIANDENYRKQYQDLFKVKLPAKNELSVLPEKAGPNSDLNNLIAWKKLNKAQRNITNLIFTNIGKAIASYVSTIRSKNSNFDFFVDELLEKGESTKLNESEQRGFRIFLSQKSGCANCHAGPLFSNKTFHNITTGIPGKDNGRSEVIESVVRDEFNCLSQYSDAKPEECLELKYINRDKHSLSGAYKTSTLRHISKTAPYMHDGRFNILSEVIDHYILVSKKDSKNNDLTPISLNEKEKADLINFLLTL